MKKLFALSSVLWGVKCVLLWEWRLSSTGEIKDAVRLAQQYNVQIYRYLTDGLVSSSLKVSQLRVELEEYTRSSMKVFVRLLEIRNSRLPCHRVREEQINVFREQMKRNDRLRQEVHNVQRGLWRLREMGQRVPMTDKHMEYTRSSMKVFVRLLEIRNSRLPCHRVREEQINVFREQMKRNDRLRQEVHNVQRGLWRLREMGQRVPMTDKHM